MKLIIAGASGFVGTELVRQSLSIPEITSVIALARRHIPTPSNLGKSADTSKFHSVVIDNYDTYTDDVMKRLAGADACIWTVAITPIKSRGIDFEEIRRVCYEYTLAGLQAMFKAHNDGESKGRSPFHFLYMSGAGAERDQSKTPRFMAQYDLMRGETENQVLAFAAEHQGAVETCVAKPGLITAPDRILRTIGATVLSYTMSVPKIDVRDISAAMLHQVVHGFEKEPLENNDLVRIGRQALKAAK
ncbi:hypothetical protein MMC11_002627 [Xylographa trunciseda]|nr:hypothetical protein [Xylographa trunciseda]